ncbi:MAG: hypothetical protein ACJ76I_07265 [Gaiellaceae bacterium]
MNRRLIAVAIAVIATALAVPTAFAAKGGKNSNSLTPTYSGSIGNLVLLDSTDGTPHWGQHVAFSATSTAPYFAVRLDCSQNGAAVYSKTIGLTSGWAVSPATTFTLGNIVWTSGAAECTATLSSVNVDGTNQQVEASTSFHVYA